ncbi:DUF1552 domain-containing protein [Allorhodopirellula solitaria]|uniref:Secreted protein containing DUF1552 n=1 Tax=Allorhodopirellula solitaria TaxID=2527987 RepID=A0A5C5X1C7_9BACT|nr:DUF1552 domain-containing protein [Allorhodopirellula solitaria]TWT56600.1 hypothetical protein CA85_41340 [Allorhodopirellula solitaria]
MTHFAKNSSLSRRKLIRGSAGVSLALPWLSSMVPAFGREASSAESPPRRFVGISNALGFHGPFLFPKKSGRDYETTRYLKPIEDLREHFTIVSGASHPGVGGGHKAEPCILSAAPYSGSNFRNTISLDQVMVRELGGETRYPSLVLSADGTTSTSYTANGSMIPPQNSPQRLFAQMFTDDTPASRIAQKQRIREGRSIMDLVGDEARAMQRRLGPGDRDKLDAYFTSVRDLERRLVVNQGWAERPKPKVDAKAPAPVRDNSDTIAMQTAMHDVIFLALQTDSTRFITMHTAGNGQRIPLDGVEQGYHQLSHHGRDEEKIAQLAIIEEAQMRSWGGLVRRLHETQERDGTLLDHTMLLLTSNLGNASAHDTKNMPVVVAGGGFKHGQHLAFDRTNNYPLPNLYTSMLQRLDLEVDAFASATGTMRGLEMLSS